MKKFSIVLVSLLFMAGLSTAANAEEYNRWERTKAETNHAVEWTVDASKRAWHATADAVGGAFEWMADKSRQGWQATREGASDAADWTLEKSANGWESAKNGAADLKQRFDDHSDN